MDKNGDESYEEVTIPVPWGHISGKWWGPRDKQPIIALHAWQDNCGTFDTLVPLLSSKSVLCIDLPGHGLSSQLPAGQCYYVFWDGVIHLRRIVKHFQWEKVKLMGHSMGGAISFLYSAIYPDEVEYVISLDAASSIRYHKDGFKNASEAILKIGQSINAFTNSEVTLKKRNVSLAYNEMVNFVLGAYNGRMNLKKSAAIMMRRVIKAAEKPNHYYLIREPRLNLFYWGEIGLEISLDFAKRIKCPYLNIRVEPGFEYVGTSYKLVLDEISKVSSHFEYYEIKGQHHVHLDEPDKVAPIINDFLDRIENNINEIK